MCLSDKRAMRQGKTDWHRWMLYHDAGLSPDCASLLTADAPVPVVKGRRLLGKSVNIPDDGVDLNVLLGIEAAVKTPALLVKVVSCAEDRCVKLGLAVDWWFECRCNGELALSTLRGGGNIDASFKSSDHCVALHLRRGRNIIAVFALSGCGFTAAAGELPDSRPGECISRHNLLEALVPSRVALRHGPYLIPAQAPGQITVVFLTDGWCGGGVEYRRKGEGDWLVRWDTIGGVLRDNAEVHRVTLEGLQPGAEHEYRVVLASGNEQCQKSDVHAFRAPPDDDRDFSFFVTGDTQFGTARRGGFMAGWRKLLEKADWHVNLGDLSSIFDDFDLMLFGGYMDWLPADVYHGKPFVAVRGNHELRGTERCRWFDLLSGDTQRGYYAFQYGQALFLMLDTGGDPTDMRNNSMTAESMREYMTGQRRWLEALVASSAYASVRYRIVLMHDAPHSHRLTKMRETARFIFEPLLRASANPLLRIHLCLTGHIHRYRRSVPETMAVYANAPVMAGGCVCGEDDLGQGDKYPFPILTVEGPGGKSPLEVSATLVKVSAKRIEVRTFDEKSRCFDHFCITPDAVVSEKDNGYKRAMLKLYNCPTL